MAVLIESLDHEGHGVARLEDGKVVFIEGALPGELVEYTPLRKKKKFDTGVVTAVLRASPVRAEPKCKYFGYCGGCSMQHLEPTAQVAVKQRILEDNLQHIGNVTPESILRPIHGQAWGYRLRGRMSVRFVEKKGGVLVGFHEKRSSFIADMESCEVLPPRISALIRPLRDMLVRLSIRERLPQAELALGDRVDVVVLRNMEPLAGEDEALLRAFAEEHHIQLWLQPKGPDSAYPFHPLDAPALDYRLTEFNVVMPFRPTEFTQVNMGVNAMLVRRAMQLLNPKSGERIADMFCGLGNFSLPIARRGATVVGVEGNKELVMRAEANAVYNGIHHANFLVANLFEVTPESLAELGHFDKMLIDPPRDGAVELVKALREEDLPRRIVYVSCNPATLARDAAVLVHTKGYRLLSAGVANMFPHTAHVESIALFEQ